ncbi:MAG: SDR family NAD(P)-dependent oxidoreductase, partial [Bacteroidota bacterium]
MGITTKEVVVITGGSKGIGFASAALFLEAGKRVSIWDTEKPEDDYLDKYKDNLIYIKCDVSKEKSIINALGETENKWGNIQNLFFSSWLQRYSTVTETTEEEW